MTEPERRLMTEPHDGHPVTEVCPGCPHPPPDDRGWCEHYAPAGTCPVCDTAPAKGGATPEPSRLRVGCSRTAHGIVGACTACVGPWAPALLAAWETWAAQHAPDLPPAHPVACPVQGCAWDTRGSLAGAGPSLCTPGMGPVLPGCEVRRTTGD